MPWGRPQGLVDDVYRSAFEDMVTQIGYADLT